ncbi:hypothetical protein [Stackebrandtia nassauensis]|uniref:Uncharacterized protein n=1 Tax=Stackebrandtia nassauensis (strain DSM 44728 / CIP 108903 / NRRL B-16338 / NBRC 102104 / LLR-40K-21) TaxID=446470 RepID=D3Q327_STANL|nr:hypothetical protein [Stackebrandtia nassauensis]ADD39997.1 hypothetical protein Snas_0279 [Stackebrandtia nassauensis DSM 44728]
MKPSTVLNRSIRLLACAATIAALALVAPATAQAAPTAALPTPGQKFDLTVTSEGIGLTIDGKAITSEPLRGTLTVTIDANPSDPKKLSVEAKPSDLTLSTKAPQTTSITVNQDNAVVDEKSILRVVKPTPATYEHIMVLDLKLTVSMPAAPGKAEEIMQLATKDPAQLRATDVKQFPPVNQQYSLAGPVELISQDGSSTVPMTLDGFDVIVNQSA